MDNLTFISEVLKAVIWPLAVIGSILLFKKPIEQLLLSLQKFKAWNLEAEFRGKSLEDDTSVKIINDIVNDKLVNTGLENKLANKSVNEIKLILAEVAEETKNQIKEKSFLIIDATPLLDIYPRWGKGSKEPKWYVSYYRYRTVSELLDDIRATLGLPNMSFGEIWKLKVEGKDQPPQELTDWEIGRRWAMREWDIPLDIRSLDQIKIKPGMTVKVVPRNVV